MRGLSTHLRLKHNINIISYAENFMNFTIPKCLICGNNRVHRGSLKFNKTCNNQNCKDKYLKNKKMTIEIKKQISKSMKKAHKEGRANNWQDSKKYHNNSYPEKFFEKVIENEFNDKNYTREYRVGPYAIDFAWVDKKLAIEIDGKQHKYEENLIRDKNKDNFLKKDDWKILRIEWKKLFNNTQKYIKITKNFVDNCEFTTNDMINIYNEYNIVTDYKYLKNQLKTIKHKQIEKIKQDLKNSNIDFSQYGWVQEAAKVIDISPQKVTWWMRRNMYNFWVNKCFKRKCTKI